MFCGRPVQINIVNKLCVCALMQLMQIPGSFCFARDVCGAAMLQVCPSRSTSSSSGVQASAGASVSVPPPRLPVAPRSVSVKASLSV